MKIQKSPGAQHCAVPEPFGPHKGGFHANFTLEDPTRWIEKTWEDPIYSSYHYPRCLSRCDTSGFLWSRPRGINRSRWAGVLGDDYTNIDKHSPGRSWLRNCAKFLFLMPSISTLTVRLISYFNKHFESIDLPWRLGLLNDWVSTFNHWRWKYIRKEAHSLAQLLSI